MRLRKNYWVGTSGWLYNHWYVVFYPEKLPRKEWFSFYSKFFDTVEINSSFYRLPQEGVFKGWREKAPDGFLYAVKVWRRITHLKKFRNVEDDLDVFLNRARLLGDKLGPVLFQAPPSLKRDVKLLDDFLSILPQGFIHVFEFRHKSWFHDEVFDTLRKHKVTFCIMDHPYIPCPREVTSDFVYIRMHGKGRLYQGLYSETDLENWASFISNEIEKGKIAFIYFNNDFGGNAVRNALQVKEMLKEKLNHE